MITTHTSICRFCHAFCALKVDVEDGRVVRVIGDKDNPMYHGYSCVKGRSLPEQHYNPERLLHTQKRGSDGTHQPIPVEQAMDEIAERVQEILTKHGPRAIASYSGTFSFHYPVGAALGGAFMSAIGSRMTFSSGSIDQPGKGIASALHGRWSAGPQSFDESDVWMLVGANPVVSMWGGIPHFNPARRLHRAKQRGMKLIVIDPRRSECAQQAEIHLQPKPGEDPTILAGMLRVILEEQLHDAKFLADEVAGLEALREAVKPYTPEYVARRADIPAEDLVSAARIFATGRVGMASAGTGPNMAPRGNLTEYLVLVLNTVCGRWMRAGEVLPNPFVLLPRRQARAQAEPPVPAWGYGEKLRVRGLTNMAGGGVPTAGLADEILLEGPGQVKALFSIGGNPMAAWPDQLKTRKAMDALDLNVTLDIKLSATAKLADYVIAPKLSLETAATTLPIETIHSYGVSPSYPAPYAQYAPALVDPPAGSEVIEEWEFFYGLAQRLGLELKLNGVGLDMERKPTMDDLLGITTRGSRIPLEEVKKYPHGHIFADPSILVEPKEDGWEERLDIGNTVMMSELQEISQEPAVAGAAYYEEEGDFSHRMVSLRMNDVYNSSGRDIPKLLRKWKYNPAFMNPADMKDMALKKGDLVEISSHHASILGIAEGADEVRRGAISMAHAFGDGPEHDSKVQEIGSNTGRLSSVERYYDPYSGIPRMSAIPVNVRKVKGL
jgi:anaerobic selenocysteine-containing dehydrogenase